MATNFKDKVSEITQKQAKNKSHTPEVEKERTAEETVTKESEVSRIRESQVETDSGVQGQVPDTGVSNFRDAVVLEEITQSVKKQLQEEFNQELKQGLREEIEQEVKQELTESITAELKENLNESILESNSMLLTAISALTDKVSKLSESMNVEIPTPIVHVNMPKVTKKVNRNEQGLVESVTEEYDDGSE